MTHELYATLRLTLDTCQPKAFSETVSVVTGAWAEMLDKIECHEPIATMAINEIAKQQPASPTRQQRRPYTRQQRKAPQGELPAGAQEA